MSITSALNNAASGLTANARMVEVASSNLANALTDGYAKRSVDLSAQNVGGGVNIDGIMRTTDRGLINDRRLADSSMGAGQRSLTSLQSLARTFGDVGDPSGLGGRLAAVEKSLISAAADPASGNRLQAVVDRMNDLSRTLSVQTDAIRNERVKADSIIAEDVETLNKALQSVEQLNKDILRLRGGGLDTSSAVDARQKAIDQISTLVPVREFDRGNGQVALTSASGETLIDGKAAVFSFQSRGVITPDMTLASGAVFGIEKNGRPLSADNGFGGLAGGAIAASFEMRDQTLVEMQKGLDDVAADLIARFADPATDPTLAPGSAGLLTDDGNPLGPPPFDGLAGRLKVNANVDPAQGGTLSRLRDGVEAVSAGPIGANSQLNAWVDALHRTDLPSGTSADGVAARFEEKLNRMRVDQEADTSFAAARWETLRGAELSLGVDTDQELQQLLRIEQAYAANAKVIQTIDFLMKRLMEM